jgi:hypothetical protein
MRIIPTFTVSMDIYHILYLSFLVPAERILPYLPGPLQPALFREGKVFLSVVCFHSRDVRAGGLPFLKFAYDQINIRTYVRDPLTGRNGVLFLFSGIASPFIAFSTNILGFPWQNISFRLEAERGSNSLYSRYEAHGAWQGPIDLRMSEWEPGEPGGNMPLNPEETFRYITSPGTGFYNIKGRPLRFEVRHSEINPRPVAVREMTFPFLLSSGLLTDEECSAPESVLIAHKGTFTIFLPPQWVKTGRRG